MNASTLPTRRGRGAYLYIAAVLVVASILLALVTGCGDSDPPPPDPPPPPPAAARASCMPRQVAPAADAPRGMKGTIEVIASGSCTVGPQESANGTVADLPSGYELWVLVEIGGFYPQQPVGNAADGPWETDEVLFGGPGTFNVHLVAAGRKGQRRFEQYFSDGAQSGTYTPISRVDLPSDVYFLSIVRGLLRPT